MAFKKLSIIDPILKAIDSEGYTIPTPIQQEAIPLVLERKDLLGCAQTGTGKTAAFAIPILQILHEQKPMAPGIKVLILTPTRELAIQIDESFAAYGKHTGLRHTVIFGDHLFYIMDKAHVKHAIGFIQHKDLQLVKPDITLAHQVE